MITFEKILNEGNTNNHLMKGIDLNAPMTSRDKQISLFMNELKLLLTNIVRQFLDTLEKNSLLGLECLFRF